MVTLYAWPTPNAHKISIMLEECEIDYKVVSVDITAGDQFKSEFLAISPNNRMPVLVDPQGPGGKAISIYGGSYEVQNNIISKNILGLPETTQKG